jgi:nitrate/nitrite transporter NarK
MIISHAGRLGRDMGLNGVWGNLGVASSARVTGVIGQYLGRRFAFVIPGGVTLAVGIAFALSVVHEDRKGSKQPRHRRASRLRTCGGRSWRSRSW